MKAINTQAVFEMWARYHIKVKSNPSLYTNRRDGNKAVLIPLPKELLDFAERSAGHHGFPTAVPVGINRKVDNATQALKEIFESPESLERFIRTSACDGWEYVSQINQGLIRRRLSKNVKTTSTTDDRPAREVYFTKYTKDTTTALHSKFGREFVLREFDVLTINEFELRFGLTA